MISKKYRITPLTNDSEGHTLNSTQVFSKDDKWVVFDTRNEDSKIGETGSIKMVNVETKEIRELYHTKNQSKYGPGVGAATFSPTEDIVLFIHGIRNSNKEHPYSYTRRTGVAIDINKPLRPVFMDARDVHKPYTKGALRGGTHAHTWSGDGKWISFTYNDDVIYQLSQKDNSFKEMRTVGVMIPHPVKVKDSAKSKENNSGEMFSVVVAQVKDHPKWGSDEIDKAFDESWIGKNGYTNKENKKQERAIAFQGEVKDSTGKSKTEIFVLDLPSDLTVAGQNRPLEGTGTTYPNIPLGVKQRRITYTAEGIKGPRFWLRTSSDGNSIFFLSKDDEGIVQVYSVSPNGGEINQITNNLFSVQGPFNISPNDKYISYLADNSVFVSNLENGKTTRLTSRFKEKERPVGAPNWSHDGKIIVFNRYVINEDNSEKAFLQIFKIDFKPTFK